jgi:hypothetical protein
LLFSFLGCFSQSIHVNDGPATDLACEHASRYVGHLIERDDRPM